MFLFSLGKYLWDSVLKDFETKLKMKNQKAREMSFKNVIANDQSAQILFNSVMSHCLQNLLNEEQDTNGGKSGKEQQLLPKSVSVQSQPTATLVKNPDECSADDLKGNCQGTSVSAQKCDMNSSNKLIDIKKGKVTNSCVDNYSKVVVCEKKQKGQCDETLSFISNVNASKCSASENINVTKKGATDATSNQGMNDKVQKPQVDSSAKSPIVKQAEEDDFNLFDDIDEDMLDDFQKDSIQSPGLVNKHGRDIDTEDKNSVSKPKRRRRRPNVNVIPDSSPDIVNCSSCFPCLQFSMYNLS